MSVDPVFADLFPFGHQSLAWVRVYKLAERQAIALALNPLDNPGASVVNNAEGLVADLRRAFSVLGQLRVFVRFPDDPRDEGWTEIIDGAMGVEFERYAVEDLEALVGKEVVIPKGLMPTCAGLGGDHHPLLALIPAPEQERNPIDDLAVVAVADLPWPHNPGACRWRDRFEDVSNLYPSSRHSEPAVGAHWFLTLNRGDFEACPYHGANWKRIAETSVAVFRELDEQAERLEALEAVHEAFGDSPDGTWCASLFSDPIVWSPDQQSVVNGQHRSCALRASGAELCVVDVGGRYLGNAVPGDPHRRASAEVASYWAHRAAD
jgi:hypothetical protein